MHEKYHSLVKKYEGMLKKDNLVFNVIGYLKLFLVLALGFLVYLMISKNFPFEISLLFAVSLITLVILWVYHNKLYDKINFMKGQISICNRQIDRMTGQWASFEDVGAEFVDGEHTYSSDLDVVGKKSLFQFLNTTKTWHGRQIFAGDLLRPTHDSREVLKRQEAIAELSGDIDYSNKILYYLSHIGVDSSAAGLVGELKDKTPFVKNKAIKFLLTYLPVLSVILVAGAFLLQRNLLYPVGAVVAAIQAVLWVVGIINTWEL